MTRGKVKWFNPTKGYGLILPDDGGDEIFFHMSAIHSSIGTGLTDKQPVTFELAHGHDGRPIAVNISAE